MEQELKARLDRGELDKMLGLLYGEDLEGARARCARVLEGFAATPTTSGAGCWPPGWTWIFWPPPQ